jgi:hypothetical protein
MQRNERPGEFMELKRTAVVSVFRPAADEVVNLTRKGSSLPAAAGSFRPLRRAELSQLYNCHPFLFSRLPELWFGAAVWPNQMSIISLVLLSSRCNVYRLLPIPLAFLDVLFIK